VATATDRLEFAPPPTPGFFRSLGLAVLAHCFLVAALTWGVQWKRDAVTISAEAELWSAVPQEAAPPLLEVPPEPAAPPVEEPAPQPQPVPVAPPIVDKPELPKVDIALEQEKLRLKKEKLKAQEKEKLLERQRLEKQRLEKLQEEKLKQEKLLLEKKRLEDKRLKDKREQEKLDKEKKTLEDKKKLAQDSKRKETLQDQLDAKKVEAMRNENMKRMAGLAGGTGSANSQGTALHSSGPSAGYGGRIRARIKPNIVFTDEIVGNPQAEVEVRTSPDGTIIGRTLTKPSGNKSWDDAVLKAIDKTEVLPRDVDGRVPPSLIISFRPRD